MKNSDSLKIFMVLILLLSAGVLAALASAQVF